MYTLRFDGIYWGIPGNDSPQITAGFMGYGWLIFRKDELLAKGHGVFARGKDANSSAAEYLAMIEGLEALLDMGLSAESIEIIGDAKGIIDQMVGNSAVNSPRIKPLYRRAVKRAARFERLHWKWTPRKQNRLADQLTRRAMRQIHLDQGQYQAAIDSLQRDSQTGRPRSRFLQLMDLWVFQPGM
jgi:ribonuclease HI